MQYNWLIIKIIVFFAKKIILDELKIKKNEK